MHPGTRRCFLKGAGLALAGAVAARVHAGQGEGVSQPFPPPVGYKFTQDGRVKPFAGNTIICHLPQQGTGQPVFDHFLDIYRELPAMRFARKITALPPSSYHMTIFGGATDTGRRQDLWPRGLAADMPIGECSHILGERLKMATFDCALPLRMRIDEREPPDHDEPLVIDLVPVDEAENRKLRRLRDELSTLLGIRAPRHDSYQFHVTLAYQTAWFDDSEQREYEQMTRHMRQHLRREIGVMELGAPEYCTFKDMFAFNRQFHLNTV